MLRETAMASAETEAQVGLLGGWVGRTHGGACARYPPPDAAHSQLVLWQCATAVQVAALFGEVQRRIDVSDFRAAVARCDDSELMGSG